MVARAWGKATVTLVPLIRDPLGRSIPWPVVCGLRSSPPTSPTSLTPTRFLGSVLIFQYQKTALHWAAQKGHPSCVALLLEHGANLEATDKVREGSEVVVKSWWWREGGRVPCVPSIQDASCR